nr:group II intron maturase-specific domain-containing protein [Thiococcus pfennigii]
MGLENNREKTTVVRLEEAGASLDFLGYTFRYERDKYGRPQRFLNRVPSAKACARERAKLREMISARPCFMPALIAEVNDQVRGWANYFRHGRSRPALRALNWYLQQRMVRHLKCRSQRPYRPPAGVSWYAHLCKQLGLVQL